MEYKEKITVIGDHDTVVGFGLAGVNALVAVTRENCEAHTSQRRWGCYTSR